MWVDAGTCVNAEEASKADVAEADPLNLRGNSHLLIPFLGRPKKGPVLKLPMPACQETVGPRGLEKRQDPNVYWRIDSHRSHPCRRLVFCLPFWGP